MKSLQQIVVISEPFCKNKHSKLLGIFTILVLDFNTKCTKVLFDIIENILGSQRRFAHQRNIIVTSSLSFRRNLDS